MTDSNKRFKTSKKVLNAGKGTLPEYRAGTKAIFHYEALCPRNDANIEGFPESRDCFESIDDTRKPYPDGYGRPMELVFGKKFQLPVFEMCLQTMLVDEISQFDIDKSELYSYPHVSKTLRDISKNAGNEMKNKEHHHSHCGAMFAIDTGYPALNELAKTPKSLRFIFHLIDVLQPESYEPEGWQLNPVEKMASISRLRQSGNEFFKKGDFYSASSNYREALGRIDTLLLREKPGDAEWVEIDQQNIPLYLNLSQCFINMKQYYEAIEAASEVLKRDEINEKALFRRAKARIAVWDLEKAEDDLKRLLKVKPELANLVDAEMVIIRKLAQERTKSDKSVYKNMF